MTPLFGVIVREILSQEQDFVGVCDFGMEVALGYFVSAVLTKV